MHGAVVSKDVLSLIVRPQTIYTNIRKTHDRRRGVRTILTIYLAALSLTITEIRRLIG